MDNSCRYISYNAQQARRREFMRTACKVAFMVSVVIACASVGFIVGVVQ